MNDLPDPLADAVRRREPDALAAFLERNKPALLSFIEHRLGAALRGKVEPPDLFQELAVKSLRELPQSDVNGMDLFGWLCHLAEQCIVDAHRRFTAGKRATGREISGNMPVGEGSQDLVALLAASLTTPSQAVMRNERERRLAEATATLPEEHREALRLRYVEGLPTKEVAARLGKSDVAIRVLLTRLIQKLQELLGPAKEA